MNTENALSAFSALSQETRLRVFRLLVEYGAGGAPAGTLGERLNIPANTLSFHLSHLARAGLVGSERRGRSIIYRADFGFFTGLIRFMAENCCRSDVASVRDDSQSGCAVIELANCCPPILQGDRT
ncbi:MAG: metalloregulator ArsR/SmtB family transcription factor [Alphaproteobacteria bacterium]|nr:metalloregulator ArsR/SmtB family transcription factor [Alphaproteobacteria bacterium]